MAPEGVKVVMTEETSEVMMVLVSVATQEVVSAEEGEIATGVVLHGTKVVVGQEVTGVAQIKVAIREEVGATGIEEGERVAIGEEVPEEEQTTTGEAEGVGEETVVATGVVIIEGTEEVGQVLIEEELAELVQETGATEGVEMVATSSNKWLDKETSAQYKHVLKYSN